MIPNIFNINVIVGGITTKQRHLILVLFTIVAYSYLIGKLDGYKKEPFEVATEACFIGFYAFAK